MILKIFIIAALPLLLLSGKQSNKKLAVEKYVPADSVKKKLIASNKEFLLDLSGDKPMSGAWEGYMSSFAMDANCRLSLDFKVNVLTHKINGACSIYYAHFIPFEPDLGEIEIMDSIRMIKDDKPLMEYIKKEIARDSAYTARFNERYRINGYTDHDSIFFNIDTIYSRKKYETTAKQRHFRFKGKCMNWISPNSLDFEKPNYFIMGNYIDSAFQSFPGYGNFELNKQ